jgi:hypothetical protein
MSPFIKLPLHGTLLVRHANGDETMVWSPDGYVTSEWTKASIAWGGIRPVSGRTETVREHASASQPSRTAAPPAWVAIVERRDPGGLRWQAALEQLLDAGGAPGEP